MAVVIILIFTLALLGGAAFVFFRARERGRLFGSFDMALFLVLMPRYDVTGDNTPREERELISHMEQLYAEFLYVRKPSIFKRMVQGSPRIAFEIASQTGGSDIEFYVAVPRQLESAFEKYIHGIYPRAVIEKVPQDYR